MARRTTQRICVAEKPEPQRVSYARISAADEQAGLAAQRRDLQEVGCARVIEEQASSGAPRPKLERVLDGLRAGDTLVVTRPDRLARSVADLLGIVKSLEAKGIGLLVLSMGGHRVNSYDHHGKLMLTMLGAVVEFERGLMLERQREGIAKAKAEKKHKGRAPTAMAKADEVWRLKDQHFGATEIARQLGIGRASVYRVLDAEK